MGSLTLTGSSCSSPWWTRGTSPRRPASSTARSRGATYGIQKFGGQVGLALFDRSLCRPTVTEAGRALLPRTRRIAQDATSFRQAARGLADGLEPELPIVLDTMFPMAVATQVLAAFTERFPTVPPRVHVQPLGAAAALVADWTCVLGLLSCFFADLAAFRRIPLLTVELIPVEAPHNPLAATAGPIATKALREHVQLVLTDRLPATHDRGHGVLSART